MQVGGLGRRHERSENYCEHVLGLYEVMMCKQAHVDYILLEVSENE